MTLPFLQSHPEKEGEYHVSKWIKHTVLLEVEELRQCFADLQPCYLASGASVVSARECLLDQEVFFQEYERYVLELLNTAELPSSASRRFFTLMLSRSLEDFYARQVGEDRFVIKARRPVIQLQAYHAFFSSLDQKIHAMALGERSFAFGLQFSYPQIYEDPHTHEFVKVLQEDSFPATLLFRDMVQWIRRETRPFSFSCQGKKVATSLRVGKKGRDWLEEHQGLKRAVEGLCQ